MSALAIREWTHKGEATAKPAGDRAFLKAVCARSGPGKVRYAPASTPFRGSAVGSDSTGICPPVLPACR